MTARHSQANRIGIAGRRWRRPLPSRFSWWTRSRGSTSLPRRRSDRCCGSSRQVRSPQGSTVVSGGTSIDVRPVHPHRFDWPRLARRAALVSSVLVVAVAGILVVQAPDATPPSAVDTTAAENQFRPWAHHRQPASGHPFGGVDRGNRVAERRGPRAVRGRPSADVLMPPASLAGSAPTPAPPPRDPVASDPPAAAPVTSAESAAAVDPSSAVLHSTRGRSDTRGSRARGSRASGDACVLPPRTWRRTRWPGQQAAIWTLAPSRTCWVDIEVRSTRSTPAPQWRSGRR